MEMVIRQETLSRRLPCRLTEEERIERCLEMAGAVEEREEADQYVEGAKDRLKAAKEVLQGRDGRVAVLSKVISSSTETRDVDCVIILDYDGKRVITRREDIAAIVSIRNMTDDELQMEVYQEGTEADPATVRHAVEAFYRRGGEEVKAAVENLRPKKGDGIDSVTISSGGRSVTLEAEDGDNEE